MNKKITFLFILITISLFVGGLSGFYFYSKNKNPETTILGKTTAGRSFGGYDSGKVGVSTNQQEDVLVVPNDEKNSSSTLPRLRKISLEPVAGADFIQVPQYEKSTVTVEPEDSSVSTNVQTKKIKPKVKSYVESIRFIERATGHVYETSTSTQQNVRISNTTIPKIYEAYFTEGDTSIILRDLVGSTDVIRTRYAIPAIATTTDSEQVLVTTDLPYNILQLAVSPNKDSIFSISDQGVTGFVSKADGGSKQALLNTPFTEWLVSWPNAKTILLTTKPSGFFPGYAYTINPDNKEFTRILGDINGLTTLMSPDATKVIYSESLAGFINLYLFDRKTKDKKILPIKTLPEKCTWSNTEKDVLYCAVPEVISLNTYPDAWYQGRIFFSDSIWKINTSSGETRLISNLQTDSGESIDVQSIKLSKNDDYLIFTNKINLQLWGLRTKDTFENSVSTTTSATSTKLNQ